MILHVSNKKADI